MASRRPTRAELIKIRELIQGKEFGYSSLKGPVFKELFAAELLDCNRIAKGKMTVSVKNADYLRKAIRQKWQIDDLDEYIAFLDKEGKDRTDVQNMLGGTKEIRTNTFQGFLVNSLEKIDYSLNGEKNTLPLINGSYLFISDYETFHVDEELIIMYVENFTTFKQISRYTYLFKPGNYLFVSRLLSSNAFKEWLKSIPNKYIHFGDFDLAGIDIYLHFFNDIGDRASFLIPEDIEERIRTSGNSSLYYTHEGRYKEMNVTDQRVQSLVDMIHKYHMGYEQEGYAK